MLVELAVGDAYGAGFEFRNPLSVRLLNHTDRYRRPALTVSRGGRYTDDTQMTIAIAEAMVSGEPWTPVVLAHHFVRAFKRDPRTGYAPRFYRFLQSVNDGADFLARIRPDSERSGAAMRSGPIGLLADIDDVLARSEVQARITHDTDAGVASAQAAALMVHHFAQRRGAPSELPEFVSAHVAGPWERPWRGRVSMKGVDCVHAAIASVAGNSSLERLLHRCVSYSGDVDTVATIALAAASLSPEYDMDLPSALRDGLEDGPFGASYLLTLDGQLFDKFPPS